jgi:hypothetical protein
MQFRAHTRFHGVRDHQIRFALDQRVEDRGVVAPFGRSLLSVGEPGRSARWFPPD